MTFPAHVSDPIPDVVLDCSGLACPLPIIRAKRAIDAMRPGQVLRLIATDRGAPADVAGWARRSGHHLLSSSIEAERFVFDLRKNEGGET